MAEEKREQEHVSWADGRALLKRIWPDLRPELKLAIAIGVLALITMPAGLVSPLIIRQIFDVHLESADVPAVFRSVGVLLGINLAAAVLLYFSALLGITLHNRVQFRVTARLFRHVLRLPLGYFDKTESGELMSRVRDDVGELESLTPDQFTTAAVEVLKAIAAFGFLLFIDIGLALSGFGFVAIFFVGFFLVARPLRKRSRAAREADSKSSARLHEALAGLMTVRTSAQEASERGRYIGAVKKSLRMSARRDVLAQITNSSFGLVFQLGLYLILAVGAYRIMKGYSSTGTLFAFFLYLTSFAAAATRVAAMIPQLQQGFASLERIFALFDQAPEETTVEEPREKLRGAVSFENVSFSYEEGQMALQGIDLTVEPGEIIALVGRSGAGKSTLVHLLPRLYLPDEGQIRLDDRPLDQYPLRWLRERIGVVPQDVFLFNRTVRENIAYAAPSASDEAVIAAARAANAHEFIEALKDGYDTVIGERGVRLSGGEKQRLAIAREFLRDPPLLILDEATSNLDAETEEKVRDAFEKLMEGRTCFVIAHRLSTVRNAGRIVALADGKIAEIGTHDELLVRGGVYADLHRRQWLGGRPQTSSDAADDSYGNE